MSENNDDHLIRTGRMDPPADLRHFEPPIHICETCFEAWLASAPRPAAIYCEHKQVLARRTEDGTWTNLFGVDDCVFTVLQAQGLV